MNQINTPNISGARKSTRARLRPSQRHFSNRQPTNTPIETETRVHDEAALNALRQSIARSLMELVSESQKSSRPPRYQLSKEGYAVYRIGMADAELLLAIRERSQGAHVKCVFFDGSSREPKAYEFYLPSMRAECDECITITR